MSSTTLYRLNGGTLIAASLLILVNSILSNVLFSGDRNTTPQQYISLPWLLVTLVSPIGSLLFVIGLPGMYLRQAGRAGVLGLVDFILVFFDFLLGAAFSTLQVTALPLLAQVAPKLLEGGLSLSLPPMARSPMVGQQAAVVRAGEHARGCFKPRPPLLPTHAPWPSAPESSPGCPGYSV